MTCVSVWIDRVGWASQTSRHSWMQLGGFLGEPWCRGSERRVGVAVGVLSVLAWEWGGSLALCKGIQATLEPKKSVWPGVL